MDPEVRKQVLRKLTYGLHIVAAGTGDGTAAGAINWLSQASFTPPLVMVGIRKDSHLHSAIERSGGFAVSILGDSQKDLAATFFKPSQIEGDKINGYRYERGAITGAPVLIDVPWWFEARVTDAVNRGDHTVYVAEIVSAGLRDAAAKPLDMWDTPWFYGG